MKRIIVIVLIAILAAGAAGGAMWYFMQYRMHGPSASAPAPAPAPVYFPLDAMTVNLQSDDDDSSDAHYLRVGITVRLDSQAAADELKEHLPDIRSRVLLALSAKKPSDLASVDGKRALAAELANLISQPTDPRGLPVHVDNVLFTEFVVQ